MVAYQCLCGNSIYDKATETAVSNCTNPMNLCIANKSTYCGGVDIIAIYKLNTHGEPTTANTTAAGTTATVTASPQPTVGSASSSGLSTGAKIGIGLGVPLGVLIAAVVAFLFLRFLRHGKTSREMHQAPVVRRESNDVLGGQDEKGYKGNGDKKKIDTGPIHSATDQPKLIAGASTNISEIHADSSPIANRELPGSTVPQRAELMEERR